jgi:lysylphosphatidylglycerol synthetase-like protein (DUF2156 family)
MMTPAGPAFLPGAAAPVAAPSAATPLRVRLIAGLTALGGVLSVLASMPVFPLNLDRVARLLSPIEVRATAHVVLLLVGLSLLYLAGNLARRKRLAWQVTVAIFALSTVSHLLRGIDLVDGFFAVFMLGLLIGAHDDFPALGDPPSLFDVVRFVPLYVGVVFGYGVLALRLEHDHISPAPTFGADLTNIVGNLVGVGGTYTYERRFFRVVFPTSLTVLGVMGLLTALVLIFRPILAAPRTEEDRERAERLVHRWGSDTLAYFALRPDKSYFFSSDGEAMIAYAYLGRYALVSGDPIGAPDSIDIVIDEFLEMCTRHAWGVAFLAIREVEFQQRFAPRGFRSFYLGEEAVIETASFALEGKKNKSMRQSVGRVARTYRCDTQREVDTPPEQLAELNAISAKWRGKAPERGFTMALSSELTGENGDVLLVIAIDEATGHSGGFLRLVPTFGEPGGYTLDMMRRDPDTPNGMTEFLVTNAVFALRDTGIPRLSMNFAVMGRLFEEDLHFTVSQRVLKALATALSPFFQIKSLHDFNRRFRPTWVSRVIAYREQRELPQIATLYSGVEGFLSVPVIGRYFVPRRFSGQR